MKQKMKMGMLGMLGMMLVGLAGCASAGPQPPPTTFDKLLLNVQTNFVMQTNIVLQTNMVAQVLQTTNTNNVTVFQTNYVPVPVPTTVVTEQTNYVYTPKSSITDTANAVGPLAGPWGTVGASVLTGILGVFAFFKNRQANTMTAVAGSTAIALQTAKQVIASLPNSAAVTASFNTWLAAHQNDANIATELAQVADQFLDPNVQTPVVAGIVAQATTPLVAQVVGK